MPSISTLSVSELAKVVFAVSNDGVITISYAGQGTITITAGSYGELYTYGILGSTTNPLVLAVRTVTAPTGLKSESYVNNSGLSLSLGVNGSAKYSIAGSGDIRPVPMPTVISVCVDNQSCNSGSSSYPNYGILHTSGSGLVLTIYHP